jgi:hypothetical protein
VESRRLPHLGLRGVVDADLGVEDPEQLGYHLWQLTPCAVRGRERDRRRAVLYVRVNSIGGCLPDSCVLSKPLRL